MNEQEQSSQLSALFDGELPSQQAELVIRRVLKDAAMRERWQRYALIGACLRGEPLAGTSEHSSVADRVSARLAAEAEILAPPRGHIAARSAGGRGATALFGRGAVGGAIAAGAALVAIFVARSLGLAGGDIGMQVAARDETALPSYTTPGANTPAANRI